MKKTYHLIIAACLMLAVLTSVAMFTKSAPEAQGAQSPNPDSIIELPEPRYGSNTSVEEALQKRRSVRNFGNHSITLADVSQLLWAAQGVTLPSRGFRTAPSSGATFPMEIYLVAGNVSGLPPGVYHYDHSSHRLVLRQNGDRRNELADSALGQAAIRQAAVNIVIAGIYERTTRRYGDRGIRYVHIEAGHVAQNVALQAVALELGSVPVGAFDDENVQRMLGLPSDEVPLYILPIGKE
jgi:SagB-type dehydrogenase family enzyme